ncbi:hypothetical protein V6x_50600 [Gimesia chilikensis]|uniref:Uncharacterized protein n=1 Tax=Gimesia chilikensis TaxID=2605989 RepID=A0A517WJ89_9PLAN|nr:hypothetical protein [Gimesia chilikensis]QDU05324.1 hypothetical protein V6x_50600 [Gimesia chilikensis]
MIEQLRTQLKTLALLDAIIEPEWAFRYFSFDSHWSDEEEVGSLRDGSGGQWFLWIKGDLAGYKCLSPDDGCMPDLEVVLRETPEAYQSFIREPAFSMDQATCIWFIQNSDCVRYGLPVQFLIDLETVSQWKAGDYLEWARDYYERDFDLGGIEKIFRGEFSTELAQTLNPQINLKDLQADLLEIGIT